MAEQLLLDFDGPGGGSKKRKARAKPKSEPKKSKEPKPKPPPKEKAKARPKPPPRANKPPPSPGAGQRPGPSFADELRAKAEWIKQRARDLRAQADYFERQGDHETAKILRDYADTLAPREEPEGPDWTIPRHWSREGAMRVMGVTTLAEVPAAYRKLVAKYHPDKPGGDARAMQAINSARDFLKALAEAMG